MSRSDFYNFQTFFMLAVIQMYQCYSPIKNVSDTLFANYDSGLRPYCSGNTQVNATIGLGLRQVIDLDEPNQVIKLNLWIRLKWSDCLLTWNKDDYDGVAYVNVPNKRIWIPDLTVYDSISSELYGIVDYRPVVYSDGSVYYNFPTLIEVLCPIDVTSFPFDTQVCKLQFGSWSYHGLELDWAARDNAADLSSMKVNVEWDVQKLTSERHVIYYGCCPEPFPDVTFYFHLKRKPAFYVTNIIIPCLMITILLILGFILPVNSGEKVSLEITVMLAMSVFQLLVADKLPPSSDSTPWIGIFFNFILGLSGVSTIIQVIVINIYFREEKTPSAILMKCIIRPACFITLVILPEAVRRVSCGNSVKQQQDLPETKSKMYPNDVDYLSETKSKDYTKDVDNLSETKSKDYPKDVDDIKNTNCEIWRCFSVAIDRLGLITFTVTLIIGCLVIMSNISL